MGEEIYYVRVATAHNAHACVGLPMQIPQTCMPLPRHDTPTTRCGRAGQDKTTAHRLVVRVAQNNHTNESAV